MTSEPSASPSDSVSGYAPPWQPDATIPAAGFMPPILSPAGLVLTARRPGGGASAALSIVAGVLLIVSGVLLLVAFGMIGQFTGNWVNFLVPALVAFAIGILLIIPASRVIGRGVAVGFGAWTLPSIGWNMQIGGSWSRVFMAAVAVASIGAILAVVGWGRAQRRSPSAAIIALAAAVAILILVGANMPWYEYGNSFTCCAAYNDRSWNLLSDVLEFIVVIGVPVWAAVIGASRRSGALFLGIAVGIGLSVSTLLLNAARDSQMSLRAGLYVTILGVVASAIAGIIGLSAGDGPGMPAPADGIAASAALPQQRMFYPQPGMQAMPQNTNTLAILALVLAFVVSPAGIVLGHIARKQIRQTGEQGDGLALAGLILGYIFTALSVIYLIIVVVLVASLSSMD
jgi:hypothetical protein